MPCLSGMMRIAAVALLAGLPAAMPATAEDDALRWRMNSLLYPKLFGEAGEHFAGIVARMSGGAFTIEVHDRLVLDQDAFGALEAGLVDAVWSSAGHHHREDPALTLFSGFPFGPDPEGFTAWMTTGGGAEALDAIYASHGLKSLYCGILPAEGGGWFRAPVETPEDLDGLRMRSFGYGARVLRKLGVVPYELPGDEIRPAFETGLIDAAEFSLPSIDADLGIAEVASHLYLPGWQQPVTSLEILMTARNWAALSPARREMLETACRETLAWTASDAAAKQVEAIAAFRDAGIELHDWPDGIITALRQGWQEVIAEEAERDPVIAEVWAGYLDFMESSGNAKVRALAE